MAYERKGRVEGKMAFITGGAQGLGKASGIMLAREGAKVTLADINEKGAAQAPGSIFEKLPVSSGSAVAAVHHRHPD